MFIIKNRKFFYIFSAILIIASILSLAVWKLELGIDFKGGTLIELRSSDDKINVSSLRDKFSQMNLGDVSVKKFGNDTDYLIKFENKDNKKNIIEEIKIIKEENIIRLKNSKETKIKI